MKNKNSKTASLALVALSAAFIAVCSWISLPFAVPFTLQTFGVFTVLGLLGGKRGSAAVVVYIFLGIIGLPVFSGFKGGIGALLGNTGGYVAGFLLSALVFWWLTSTLGKKTWVSVLSMIAGLIVCYAFGTAWFMYVYLNNTGTVSLITVLSWCVFPFIIPDIAKICLSNIISRRLKRYIPK